MTQQYLTHEHAQLLASQVRAAAAAWDAIHTHQEPSMPKLTPSQAAHLEAIAATPGRGYCTFLDVAQAIHGDNPTSAQTGATTRALNALINGGHIATTSDEHANTLYYATRRPQ